MEVEVGEQQGENNMNSSSCISNGNGEKSETALRLVRFVAMGATAARCTRRLYNLNPCYSTGAMDERMLLTDSLTPKGNGEIFQAVAKMKIELQVSVTKQSQTLQTTK